MFIVFNIILLAFLLLIAYWWANQGAFSAVLHLLCVIVAGAIALAVWEPLTTGLLLRGNRFDDYAWGTALIVVFAVVLLILRIALDKLVPGNIDLPQWANLTFGFIAGAAAGVLTLGIVIIGMGFIQSTNDIMNFRGMVRTPGGKIVEYNRLWAPLHEWTAEFYSFASAGSLYPTFSNTPLRHYNPDLHFQAASLVRDTAANGRAKLSLRPADVRIDDFVFDAQTRRYAVRVHFESGARDFGQQLTLSSSQIRLIGYASGFDEAPYVHPDRWMQYSGIHFFDDPSHYITSEPGQATVSVTIDFPGEAFGNTPPRFLQIRNTRFRLPQPRQSAIADAYTATPDTGPKETLDESAVDIQSAITQSNGINPVTISSNQRQGLQVNDDRFITGGSGEFTLGGDRPSRALMIPGIFEPPGTRIVQVDVSRESAANLFGNQALAGTDAKVMLVDSLGRAYYPVGYLHQRPDGRAVIKVNFQTYIDTIGSNAIPPLPTAGGQPLRLYFAVTEGATVRGLKLGPITIGTCNLQVRNPRS